MSSPLSAREQWRERGLAGAVLLLAGLLCWQSAGVVRRARDRARAVTGVTEQWLAEANDVQALAVLARQREALGDAAGVVALTRRVIARRPLDAENRVRLALGLAAQGEHARARLHVAQAARVARNHPELLLHCGEVRLRAWEDGRDLTALRDALRYFREALGRDHRLLARVRTMLGGDAAGLGGASNVFGLVPDHPAAWREAARVFTASEDWEAAAAAYRRAGASGEERAVEALARAHAEARAGKPEIALGVAAQAVEVARPPERARVIRSAARLLRTLPDPFIARGEALCVAWAERWPVPATAQTELAEWRLHRGDVSGALAVIVSLPAEVREEAAVLDLRGRVAGRAGQPEVAETYFRRAWQAARNDPVRWLRLIHWIEGRGRIDEALALADQALQRHPVHPGVAATRERLVSKSVGVPPK